jgi:hypothetical protein
MFIRAVDAKIMGSLFRLQPSFVPLASGFLENSPIRNFSAIVWGDS